MIESFTEFWTEVWEIRIARWIVFAALISVSAMVAVYFGKIFRNMAIGMGGESIDYMAEFEKMKRDGKLDKSEFDRLKTAISLNEVESEPGSRAPEGGLEPGGEETPADE